MKNHQKIDAEVAWKFATGDNVYSSPVLSPDGSTVYVGSYDDNLYALHTADGTKAWKFDAGYWVVSSLALSPDGSTVYVGCFGGLLYGVHAANGTEAWKFEPGWVTNQFINELFI